MSSRVGLLGRGNRLVVSGRGGRSSVPVKDLVLSGMGTASITTSITTPVDLVQTAGSALTITYGASFG